VAQDRKKKSPSAGKGAGSGAARLPVGQRVSSGGVLYRHGSNGVEVALIGLKGGKVWALPKGTVEPDEDPAETALREVREETGFTGRCEGKIGEIEYWFVDRAAERRIHKRVYFYLLTHTGGDASQHDFEVDEVQWVPLHEALARLTYRSEREIVEKARDLLCGKV
jgi:8-oxo-dGTP pyrophosphatase MutT (NUDIX family)